jgi:methylenetetrahydrofolate dehydrogenase (NADP+)/methenyltetrahydrofolate cyclohydrolase
MSAALVVDGKAIAASLEGACRAAVEAAGVSPRLAVVLAAGEESAAAYTRSLARAGARVGAAVAAHELAPDVAAASALIRRLAEDAGVHGIILQKPFAGRAADGDLAELIPPAKDADGQTSASLGRLWAGRPGFIPSTAAAAVHILAASGVAFRGATAVVVGRSVVVGKPAAALLVARDATVTICHTKTRDLAAECRRADILIVAAGAARLVRGDMIKEGAAVIDCGYNFLDDGAVVGDVDFDEAVTRASLITPPNGGVGPVTTALLLAGVARAAGATING